ncbi:hypothetical protein FS749_014031 [Ceratobasidium sp. UAMH 11750]|nr:hypothetical protein FS749_014031 [Ceratobasidium sp. UAMH 11750]
MWVRNTLVVAVVVASTAVGLGIRTDSTEGQPISVGLAANRSLAAVSVFGTSNSTVNFLQLPKDLCVVPMYQSEAGMSNDTTALLICQQALEICPQATSIVVSNSTKITGITTEST